MVSVVVFMMDKTANQGGIPFAFTSVSLFSNANTDYLMLSLDIIFWFIILFGIWKLVGKLLKR
ncbi:MAG: hypothetical protein Q7R97_04385 [Candidatus Daviesbacteria bacterium]|nr:hypothetical protein [Candidatus Daviesbacteria bacterium]